MHDLISADYYFGRQAAWHGLGTVISDRDVSAVEAVQIARLDYKVGLFPLNIELDSGNIPLYGMQALTRLPIPEDDNHRVFNVVSDRYQIMQNAEVFGALNPLSELWPVETAGAIEEGRRAFMCLKAGEYEVRGPDNNGSDLLELYYLVINDFAGAIKIRFTPIRVVCKNTLTMSDKNFTVNANIVHKGSAVFMEYAATLKLVAQLQGVQSDALAILSEMGRAVIDNEEASRIFDAAFPMPKKARKLSLMEPIMLDVENNAHDDLFSQSLAKVAETHEQNTMRNAKHIGALHEIYELYNDMHPHIANTAYAAYNVVVDYLDHVQSGGGRAESTVFGLRAKAKARAFDVAAKSHIK